MAITKEGKKYKLDARPAGPGTKRYVRLFDTKLEANAFFNKILTGRIEPKGDNRQLSDLINTWYDLHGRSLKSSIDTRDRLLSFSRSIGNPAGFSITSEKFAKYRALRLDKGIKPATLNRELSTLKALFRELKRLNIIDYDSSVLTVRKIKEVKTELSFLTSIQIKRLIEETKVSKNDALYYVVTICLATGARWSEAEGVKLNNLANGGINFLDTKNGHSRFVPVQDHILNELKGYLKIHGSFKSCYAAYRSAFERSGIECPAGQSAHILRHTFASHFTMNGGNIKSLQQLLGHSSLQMTMRYAHLSPDYLNQVKDLNPLANLIT